MKQSTMRIRERPRTSIALFAFGVFVGRDAGVLELGVFFGVDGAIRLLLAEKAENFEVFLSTIALFCAIVIIQKSIKVKPELIRCLRM